MTGLANASDFRYSQISEGMKFGREYIISKEVYDGFLRIFDDRSPIHVDPDYARECNFKDPVMHGAILNGFLSHFIGMHFPGRLSLLLGVDLRYATPSFLNDRIHLEALVAQKMDAGQVVILNVFFRNLTQNQVAARGRVQVYIRNES